MALQKVEAKSIVCDGCYYHKERPKPDEQFCNKPAEQELCVSDPSTSKAVYYIFKEISDEEQNETMAP